jgi:hypothetical protein
MVQCACPVCQHCQKQKKCNSLFRAHWIFEALCLRGIYHYQSAWKLKLHNLESSSLKNFGQKWNRLVCKQKKDKLPTYCWHWASLQLQAWEHYPLLSSKPVQDSVHVPNSTCQSQQCYNSLLECKTSPKTVIYTHDITIDLLISFSFPWAHFTGDDYLGLQWTHEHKTRFTWDDYVWFAVNPWS